MGRSLILASTSCTKPRTLTLRATSLQVYDAIRAEIEKSQVAYQRDPDPADDDARDGRGTRDRVIGSRLKASGGTKLLQ
jgi:hypothetical protein